jgi:hypothetical protein
VSGLTSKSLGQFLIGLGLKTDDDDFRWFDLKTSGDNFYRFDLKTSSDGFLVV